MEPVQRPIESFSIGEFTEEIAKLFKEPGDSLAKSVGQKSIFAKRLPEIHCTKIKN